MTWFAFRCGHHFQRQQWGLLQDVTASWVPYHEHYVIRPFPLCGLNVFHPAQMIKINRQLHEGWGKGYKA